MLGKKKINFTRLIRKNLLKDLLYSQKKKLFKDVLYENLFLLHKAMI